MNTEPSSSTPHIKRKPAKQRRTVPRARPVTMKRTPTSNYKLVCPTCESVHSVDEISMRLAAYLTHVAGPDIFCMRFRQIRANLVSKCDTNRNQTCGSCLKYPPTMVFYKAVEVNTDRHHEANLRMWFGDSCVPPIPPNFE